MQLLSLTILNKIFLDDDNINTQAYKITFSAIDEYGNFVKNDKGAVLNNTEAVFDDNKKRYAAKFMLDPTTKADGIRINFNIQDSEGCFVQSKAYLVDCLVDRQSNNIQLVSASEFIDYLLNMAGGNIAVRDKILSLDKIEVAKWISASTGNVERDLEMCLTRKTIEMEKHDYYGDDIGSTWWMIYTLESPILKVNSYELWEANQMIQSVEPKYLLVRGIEGEIQFIPVAGTDNSGQAVFINHLEAAILGKIINMGGDYVPSMFRLSYDTGLDYMNMPKTEKDGIKLAIEQKTLFDNLIIIRDDLLKASEAVSADGASYSFSNNMNLFVNKQQTEYTDWVTNMKKKYCKLYKMTAS